MIGFTTCTAQQYYSGDLIQYNEMDGTRGTVRGGGIQGFDGEIGNRPLRKLKLWWDDNIKMDPK
jgi:hypothetical protein